MKGTYHLVVASRPTTCSGTHLAYRSTQCIVSLQLEGGKYAAVARTRTYLLQRNSKSPKASSPTTVSRLLGRLLEPPLSYHHSRTLPLPPTSYPRMTLFLHSLPHATSVMRERDTHTSHQISCSHGLPKRLGAADMPQVGVPLHYPSCARGSLDGNFQISGGAWLECRRKVIIPRGGIESRASHSPLTSRPLRTRERIVMSPKVWRAAC